MAIYNSNCFIVHHQLEVAEVLIKVGPKDYNSLPAVVHHQPMQSMEQPFRKSKTRDSNSLPAVSQPGPDQGLSEHNNNPDGHIICGSDVLLLEKKSVPVDTQGTSVTLVQEGRSKQQHKTCNSENGSSVVVNRCYAVSG